MSVKAVGGLLRSARSMALGVVLLFGIPLNATGKDSVLRLYLDADRQDHVQSAHAIELGVRTALAAVENRVAGYDIEVVPLDHRGNVKRSMLNIRQYLADDRALAVFGGMHSPPYLRYKDFINAQRVLMLLPWSAAGPLTRVDSGENWIFRLSIDDTKAADRLVDFAVHAKSCARPSLVLWDSGWGRTNEKTLNVALTRSGLPSIPVFYFQGSLEQVDAYFLADKVSESESDCVLLVANAREGVQVVTELSRLADPPAVISHWGITGGDFEQYVDADIRERVDLHFLQTCYPIGENRRAQHDVLQKAWAIAQQLNPAMDSDINTLRAPAGFFHGYDLATLLIEALSAHPGVSDIEVLRSRVHATLENLHQPVEGLMRVHQRPFQPYSAAAPDAHEGLGLDDMCMARWDAENNMQIVPTRQAVRTRQ